MEFWIYLSLVLVCLIYLKWVLVIVLYPLELFYGFYQRNKNSVLLKILAAPNFLVEEISRGGGQRFVIYNISTLPSNILRKYLYKGLGAKIEKKVVFHFKTEIRSPYRLRIGQGTIIGDNAILDARSGLVIGKNVNLSSNASIYTLQHDHRSPSFGCFDNRKMSVEIDDRVWIGSNVVVLPGVHIGEGAVCCAGCVVTKDVEPYAVVAGIPARKVGERPRNLSYSFDGKSCWFY